MARVTSHGVVTESLAEKRADLERRFRELFGDDLTLDPETPQGQIAGIMALVRAETDEAIARLAAGGSVSTAEGNQLDDLGSLIDIGRLAAVHSRVTCRLTGVAGTNVPAGSRAKTDEDVQWVSLTDAILSPAGVDVEFEAAEAGPVIAASGTITQIVTVIPGWETITNAQGSTEGVNRQSDDAYRRAMRTRTGRPAVATIAALESGLHTAGAGKTRVIENTTDASITVQGHAILPHSFLCIVQGGSDRDLTRSILAHRGMGVGVTVSISGRTITTADLTALAAITSGTVTYGGTDYAGLDLSGASDADDYASALTTLLATPGVTVHYAWPQNGYFVAALRWSPNAAPEFTGTDAGHYGLVDGATLYPGPFIRPRDRELTISAEVAVRPGFPADGLAQLRDAIFSRIEAYGIGEQVWYNDILSAIEGVAGTRITTLSVQESSRDISGQDVPLDVLWTLPQANLTITLTGI